MRRYHLEFDTFIFAHASSAGAQSLVTNDFDAASR
jgi:hypothetical protein